MEVSLGQQYFSVPALYKVRPPELVTDLIKLSETRGRCHHAHHDALAQDDEIAAADQRQVWRQPGQPPRPPRRQQDPQQAPAGGQAAHRAGEGRCHRRGERGEGGHGTYITNICNTFIPLLYSDGKNRMLSDDHSDHGHYWRMHFTLYFHTTSWQGRRQSKHASIISFCHISKFYFRHSNILPLKRLVFLSLITRQQNMNIFIIPSWHSRTIFLTPSSRYWRGFLFPR